MSDQPAEGLSVLLPVCNQAANLERALTSWLAVLERLGRDYELLVVDDGSSDDTKALLLGGNGKPGLRERLRHVDVLEHDKRRGYGASTRTGLAVARYPLIFCTGCDYPYNPADLKALLKRIDERDPETGAQIDVVNGYRTGQPVTGWRKRAGALWRLLLRLALNMHALPRPGWLGRSAHHYALLVRCLFGPRVGDVDSRFKLFRKRIFERIPIQSDGDFVHAEILAKANFLGCLMDELPIAERPGPFPAQPEPPAPTSRWSELRRVFVAPAFGNAGAKSAEPSILTREARE
jgi:glycosyltransferase involved in cell wall biosynthesis